MAQKIADPAASFVVLACQWPVPDRATLRRVATTVRDWRAVLALAERHRVIGFVWRAVVEAGPTMPSELLAGFKAAARANTRVMLTNFGEEARLAEAFRDAGLDALFIKGTTLGTELYDAADLKTSWDIDLLVRDDQLLAAAGKLRSLGYAPRIMAEIHEPASFDRFLIEGKETVWWHTARHTAVELHRYLVDYPRMIPAIGMLSPRRTMVGANGVPVETLADAELFAFLCVHGTLHRWRRLKWLVDVAALIARTGAAPAALYESARRLGAGPSAAVALLLCHRVLGLPLAPELQRNLTRSPATRWIVASALRALRASGSLKVRDEVATLIVHLLVQGDWIGRISTVWMIFTMARWPFHLGQRRWVRAITTLAVLPYRLVRRRRRLRSPASLTGRADLRSLV